MQFKAGDFVVHPTYGIGHVISVEERKFSDREARLYYHIALPRRVVWIPVEAKEDNGLRLVVTRRDLDQYRKVLKSPPVPLDKNHHRRHLELVGRLKQGAFRGVCEVVRDLTAWSRRKPLGPTDTATLRRSRQNLCQEWARAAGISTTEAIAEIESLLRVPRQRSTR